MFFRKSLTVLSLLLVAFVLGGSASGMYRIARSYQPAFQSVVAVTTASRKTTPDEVITVSAVGDIMLGSTNPPERGLPPQDGALMLSQVSALLEPADIAFGNLEGPLLEGGTSSKCAPKSTACFAFRVPTRYGKYLKEAGFDLFSTANNHASDFGLEGRESTRRVLDKLGIAHAGTDLNDIPYLNVKGRKIGVVAFATSTISYNLNNIEAARRVVAGVAAKSDIVIVSFHGGAEGLAAQHVPRGPEIFLREARGDLRAFTHAVVDAGADLVLGHGPHVVRGMEVYKNRLIVYSLGNFAFYRFPFKGPTALSLVLDAHLAPDGAFLGGKINPLVQDGQNGPQPDSKGAVINVVRQLSKEDFGSSSVRVNNDGTILLPE